MIKFLCKSMLLVLVIFVPAHGFAEVPAEDKLMATVRIKPNLKLDAQARKEIAAVVARIKKLKVGTVKLRGSYPAAATEDEYLSKSVLMAREVEQYMKTLLPARQKVYILFSPFSDEKRTGECVVEIFLYPHELKAADFEGFRVNTVEGKPVIRQISGGQAETQAPVAEQAAPAAQSADDGKRMVKPADDGKRMVKPAARPEPPEDARRAEELVRKAKARAAKRAKQRADAE